MNNDYLGYIKIFIHLFVPLKKLLSSTKERCKDRTFFIYVENLLTFGGFPRFYHELFSKHSQGSTIKTSIGFQATPFKKHWMHFLQGSTIKISMCFKGSIF
jgi:hypothetical protein